MIRACPGHGFCSRHPPRGTDMSAFIVICAIIAVLFWRSVLKIAAIVAVGLMMFGAVALFHIIR